MWLGLAKFSASAVAYSKMRNNTFVKESYDFNRSIQPLSCIGAPLLNFFIIEKM